MLARGIQRDGQWRGRHSPENVEFWSGKTTALLAAEVAHVWKMRPDLKLVAVADAALDNWTFLGKLRPDEQAVDFFHACEHLGEVADRRDRLVRPRHPARCRRQLSRFVDVYDNPSGQSFEEVLLHQLGKGAVMAVHSDSYFPREWCRREVIETKRRLVRVIVVDCVRDIDSRGIRYLGNVPIVRMDLDRRDQIGTVAGCLLDEVFRTWLWLYRIQGYLAEASDVLFTARPPELIVLAAMSFHCEGVAPAIVYPDPLLSTEEGHLFSKIAPNVRVQTLTEWLDKR